MDYEYLTPLATARRPLGMRILAHLRTQGCATVRQLAAALQKSERHTDNAVRILRERDRIKVVQQIDSPSRLGVLINVYGIVERAR